VACSYSEEEVDVLVPCVLEWHSVCS
jgi:hypothetical protein